MIGGCFAATGPAAPLQTRVTPLEHDLKQSSESRGFPAVQSPDLRLAEALRELSMKVCKPERAGPMDTNTCRLLKVDLTAVKS